MLVHDRDAALLAGLLSGLARRRLPLVVLALVAWGLACLGAGIALERSGAWEEVVLPAALKNVRLPVHAVRGWLSDPEELVLDLDHEAYQRLAFQREQALAAGVLSAGEDDFVPAAIRIGEGRVRAAVRLKGDRLDHLEGSKWSLRVRVKGGETVLGMRQFSLQHPGLRSYADEWLFHRALAREDVLGLRYRFVSVILNGRRLGVYALEEHLDRTLVEHQRRREGVIVRFDETLNWVHLSTDGADSFARAAVDPFHGEEVAAREELAAQFRTAHTLLEGYRQGRLSASQVFDVERLARFYALTDLLGAGHAARWANQRFYYNPVTARL
ncbi:MAG: CotH kinase family protein, partial [Planctomycetes bacterium]|nr:CotH kinase family protein [Planctomycetota bacterium]